MPPSRSTRLPPRLLGAVALLTASLSAATDLLTAPALAQVVAEISVDGGPSSMFALTPDGVGACGPLYADLVVDPAYRIGWNLSILDGDRAQLLGEVIVANHAPFTSAFDIQFTIPFSVPGPWTLHGGELSGLIKAPAAGASFYTSPSQSILEVSVDSMPIATLLDDPFGLVVASSDCAFVGPASYGQPSPSLLGPAVFNDASVRLSFTLSAGAEVAFTLCVLVETPNTVTPSCVCTPAAVPLSCTSDSIAEAETCGAVVNDGCGMSAPAFETIACGDVICGTAWADLCGRDEDWYEIVVTQPTIATITAIAAFPLRLGIADTAGSGVCVPTPPLAPVVNGPPGVATELVVCLDPGTWWVVVGVDALGGFPCGSGAEQYEISLECCTLPLQTSYYALTGISTNVPWEWQIETSDFVAEGVTPAIPMGQPATALAAALAQSVHAWSGNVQCGGSGRINVSTFGMCPAGGTTTAMVIIRACGAPGGGPNPFPTLRVRQVGATTWCEPNSTTIPLACSSVFGCTVNPSFLRIEPSGLDCNENGVDDGVEILIGEALDLNGNGIPDECDACLGDLNSNGVVDGADLGAMLGQWGQAGAADLDGNSIVNGADLGILLTNWGTCD